MELRQMNLPEDRHPLLYVYLDNDQPERIRSRCVAQGATSLLGKWPEHLTFSWMMAVIGLGSLVTCFLLAVILLIVSSSNQNQEKRALLEKCERNEHVVQLVHMKNLEDLAVNENATYFVEVYTNKTNAVDSACSLESYLRQTSLPVFLVSIISSKSLENLTVYNELEKKFKNFNIITFDLNSFFNRTIFSSFQNQNAKFLTFLAKILVSWNVGGTVIDSKVRTLKDFRNVLQLDDQTVIVGTFKEDVFLLSAKRFCHVYIFDVLKTITENRNILKYTELEVIEKARKRFCHGRSNCNAVKLESDPEFCSWNTINENCTFSVPYPNELNTSILSNFTWENFCPLVKAMI